MKELINAIDGSTAKVLLIVFASFALWVIKEFRSDIKNSFKKHEDKINSFADGFKSDILDIKRSMAQHAEDMDSTEKRFAQHAVHFREDLSDAKVNINKEITQTKIDIVKLNRTLLHLTETVEKYRKDLVGEYGKIRDLDKSNRKNKEDIGRVVQIVGAQSEEYGKVMYIAEKGHAQSERALKAVQRHSETIKKVEDIFARSKKKKS